MSDDNYYEELGVEPGASRDELRDAHRKRLADLETARGKKGFSDSQLQANRDEAARVRAAWNVLSDPFQRQRYDAQLGAESEPSSEVELVDDDDTGAPQSTGAGLTGWRKLLAPPPPKDGAGNGNGNGKGNNGKPPTRVDRNGRPRPEPTVVLPAGMRIAEPRVRGMALLFDISILIVIFFSISLIVPRLIQSDYQDIQDRITKTNDLHDARQSLSDAQKSVNDAKSNADAKSAQKDLTSAEKDYKSAVKDAKSAHVPAQYLSTDFSNNFQALPTAKRLQTYSDNQADKIKTTGYVTTGLTFVLALAYLVPMTARKGRTLGMRGRKIKVVRVDGSPVGWYAAFTRFALPILLALAIPSFGVILGLGMVAWGFFDRNGQGIHDKLARTLVVDA
jgi:curved DNA-binding protein CbpA